MEDSTDGHHLRYSYGDRAVCISVRKKPWGFSQLFYPGFSNGCLFLLQVSPQTDVQGMDVSDDKNPHGVVNSGKKTGKFNKKVEKSC
ncbi:MAG: hypothetical protein PHC41_13495 [Lachnospiraceae bacterium]|nr:hypothetical protein [Lachnospiraceae bacterium]MDD3617220.1 hypothetical protein [Lachnospiraceae bacterium]